MNDILENILAGSYLRLPQATVREINLKLSKKGLLELEYQPDAPHIAFYGIAI
jgi:hypothetical protein